MCHHWQVTTEYFQNKLITVHLTKILQDSQWSHLYFVGHLYTHAAYSIHNTYVLYCTVNFLPIILCWFILIFVMKLRWHGGRTPSPRALNSRYSLGKKGCQIHLEFFVSPAAHPCRETFHAPINWALITVFWQENPTSFSHSIRNVARIPHFLFTQY